MRILSNKNANDYSKVPNKHIWKMLRNQFGKKIVDSWICEFVKMPSPNYENKTLIKTVLNNNNVSLRLLGTETYVMKLSQMMH